MVPPSYMQSVTDLNVIMRLWLKYITVRLLVTSWRLDIQPVKPVHCVLSHMNWIMQATGSYSTTLYRYIACVNTCWTSSVIFLTSEKNWLGKIF